MNITTLGIDLAKNVFQLHGTDGRGQVVLRRTLRRNKLVEFMVNLSPCKIVMEACGGANFWARKFVECGHEVNLISPQFAKPFVQRNKNDYRDAEAIVEAASRPNMRYVSPKTVEQQDMQSLLRIREGSLKMRTQMSNQLRGLLAEYGIVMSCGLSHIRKALPALFDKGQSNGLTDKMKALLERQYALMVALEQQIKEYDKEIEVIAKTREDCQRIQAVPGIGPITAVALSAMIGNPRDFKNGRHFAAYLGLVPKQHSSGGRERLLGISKRGDSYLRQLLIHGARSVLQRIDKKLDARSVWLKGLKLRAGMNRTSVALANKNARVVMALLLKEESYRAS